jgi:Fe-S cluster assembly protein SufD
MSAIHDPVQDYLALCQARSPSALPWLQELRRQALAHLAQAGLPGAPWEEWKYTDVRPLLRQRFVEAEAAVAIAPVVVEGLRFDPQGPQLVFVNGRFAPHLSRLVTLPEGVLFAPLAEMLRTQPQRLEPHLGRLAAPADSGFGALNLAAFDDGCYLYVPAEVVLPAPVQLLFLSAGPTRSLAQPRILVVAERNSEAVLVEHHLALDQAEAHLTNIVSECWLGGNAQLTHYRLQEAGARGFQVAGMHVRQARDSRFESHNVYLSGQLVRNDIHTRLAEPGSAAQLNGLYVAGARQHIDNHTVIEHQVPNTSSEEVYHGVLTGAGRAVFNGRVIVAPGAQKTDARQSNRNLLLAANAEIDTKPELQIYANDVKCSHGTTVGQLDPNALFYLRSRGLDEATARALLTLAFAEEVLARMALPRLRSHITQRLVERLPQAQELAQAALGLQAGGNDE